MLNTRLNQFKLAMMLLTRIPVGNLADPVPSTASSGWAWPLAGLAISLPGCLVYFSLYYAGFGAQVSALGLVAAQALLTGAMHEDGLADMTDGFGGGTTKERKLEIMRDSHIGSYGVLALIFAVALQISLVAEIAAPHIVVPAAIGIAMASRGLLPFWLRQMPPARADGLGRSASNIPFISVCITALIGLCGLFILGPLAAVLVIAAMLLTGALVYLLAMKQIGGQTGDVIGAIQKLSELSGWATLLVIAG
jgi:adenosylcobinamide-GDP ribazoletransferase